MHGFWVLAHVVLALATVGPVVLLPYAGVRAVGRRDAATVHRVGRAVLLFAALSLTVFGTGMLAVASSGRHGFGTTWVVVSTTLYAPAALLSAGAIPLALARAAKDIEDHLPAPQLSGDDATEPPHRRGSEALQRDRGRITALAGLVAVLYTAITVLMVLRPFGD